MWELTEDLALQELFLQQAADLARLPAALNLLQDLLGALLVQSVLLLRRLVGDGKKMGFRSQIGPWRAIFDAGAPTTRVYRW